MSRIMTSLAVLLAWAGAPAVAQSVGEPNWSGKVAVGQAAEKTIEYWPELARAAARAMIAKYGRPTEVGASALVWYGNGPWKKSIVHRRAWPHYSFELDKDYLENTIAYWVPDDKVAALTRFDKRLDVDQALGEISTRSESEKMNYLALNLADEIVRGKRTVENAREFYIRTARLAASGKASSYLNGFLFEVHNDVSPLPRDRR